MYKLDRIVRIKNAFFKMGQQDRIIFLSSYFKKRFDDDMDESKQNKILFKLCSNEGIIEDIEDKLIRGMK